MVFTDNSTVGRKKKILSCKMEMKMYIRITNLEIWRETVQWTNWFLHMI